MEGNAVRKQRTIKATDSEWDIVWAILTIQNSRSSRNEFVTDRLDRSILAIRCLTGR